MVAKLVFVHGIGSHRIAEEDCRRWVSALAEGARRAGHSQLAADLVTGDPVPVVFAYYRELFGKPQAQGTGAYDLDTEQVALLVDLLTEVVDAQLAQERPEPVRSELLHARAQLVPDGQPQGVGGLARRAVSAATTLLGIGPLHHGGQWISGRVMVRDLAQVVRYLARGEPDGDGLTLDQRIRARVVEALGEGPSVVVAHSLGSVVALEALHEHAGEVPLLVTVGSPIGMRLVVWPRLVPRPPCTPAVVRRWLNFWDRDDIVAVRPQLAEVGANAAGVRPESARVDSDGIWVHTATKYLGQAAVAGPVAESLGDSYGRAR